VEKSSHAWVSVEVINSSVDEGDYRDYIIIYVIKIRLRNDVHM
jgi:hypothetical protein